MWVWDGSPLENWTLLLVTDVVLYRARGVYRTHRRQQCRLSSAAWPKQEEGGKLLRSPCAVEVGVEEDG